MHEAKFELGSNVMGYNVLFDSKSFDRASVVIIRSLLFLSFFSCHGAKAVPFPVDTGRKLNIHKTFRRRPGRLLNVLCTFNLRPVSTGFDRLIQHNMRNTFLQKSCKK